MNITSNWSPRSRTWNWYLATSIAVGVALIISALAASLSSALAQSGGGNVECEGLGFQHSSGRINYNEGNGTFSGSFPDGVSVSVSADHYYVSWTSTFPIGAVIVKASNDALVYSYADPGSFGDSNLITPETPSGNQAALSNLTFCWNTAPDPDPDPASAQVQKVTVPAGDEAGWEFKLRENGSEVASLTTTGGGFHTFVYELQDGKSYEIVETEQSGFTQTGSSGCSFTVSYPGDNDRTFQCTITNTADQGPEPSPASATVEKVTVPAGDEAGWQFALVEDTTEVAWLTTSGSGPHTFNYDLVDGASYNIVETEKDGFTQTGSSGCSFTVSYPDDNDRIFHCTITNTADQDPDPDPGTIIIQKVTDPAGSDESFDFVVDGYSNFSLMDGQNDTTGDLEPGTYVITETVPDDWDLASIVCNAEADATVVGTGVTIELGEAETVTCTFTNVERGAGTGIIVEKLVDGDSDGEEFNFTLSGPGLSDSFTLGDGGTETYSPLVPGSYTVTELVGDLPDGWNLIDITVNPVSAETSSNLGNGETVVELESGQTIRITYTNQPPEDSQPEPGQINITKVTDPAGSEEAFSFNASYYGASFDLEHGETDNSGDLEPGVYTVTEQVPDGWNLTNVTCDAATSSIANGVSIELGAGQVVNCTFTNAEVPPPPISQGQIIINKITDPAGNNQQFDFVASYGTFSLAHGESNNSGGLNPGLYNVAETVPANWNLDEINCSGGDAERVGDSVDIDLAEGQTVICTFLNALETIPIEDVPGEITIAKETAEPSDEVFSFGGDFGSFELGDGDSETFGDLQPGTYTVSETVPEGWTLTSINCDSGSVTVAGNEVTIDIMVDNGQSVTCTFLNTEDDDETLPIEDDDETRPIEDDDETRPIDDDDDEDRHSDDEDETLPIEDKPKKDHDKKKPAVDKPKSDDDALPLMPRTGSGPGTGDPSSMGFLGLLILGSAALVAGIGLEVRRKLRSTGY